MILSVSPGTESCFSSCTPSFSKPVANIPRYVHDHRLALRLSGMEQPTFMPLNFPDFRNTVATCSLPAGKGPWPALVPKTGRRTVCENGKLKPHSCPFRGLKSKNWFSNTWQHSPELFNTLIRTCSFIPFCQQHSFHTKACLYASLAYSPANAGEEICGSEPHGCRRG